MKRQAAVCFYLAFTIGLSLFLVLNVCVDRTPVFRTYHLCNQAQSILQHCRIYSLPRLVFNDVIVNWLLNLFICTPVFTGFAWLTWLCYTCYHHTPKVWYFCYQHTPRAWCTCYYCTFRATEGVVFIYTLAWVIVLYLRVNVILSLWLCMTKTNKTNGNKK